MSKQREALELAREFLIDIGLNIFRDRQGVIDTITSALAEPEQPVAFDYLQAHTEAEQFVRGSLLWKRFIDGTPLSNDIAVWMADFARKYAAPVAAPAQISDEAQSVVLQPVLTEVERAMRKFPTWPTDPLHAVAVLGEEFGELTQAVLQVIYEPEKSSINDVRTEAIQTAAMTLRFLASLNEYQFQKSEQHSQARAVLAAGGKP